MRPVDTGAGVVTGAAMVGASLPATCTQLFTRRMELRPPMAVNI